MRGKNLGIDSSVIEANASLRALVHRNTEEQYWDYVKRLAAESGIDPENTAAFCIPPTALLPSPRL